MGVWQGRVDEPWVDGWVGGWPWAAGGRVPGWVGDLWAGGRAKARADITYRQLRVKEFVDTVEIWDDRALKWDELTHRSGDKENGFDRAVAAYTVL